MLADYALGSNRGGYTSAQKKLINDAGKLFTYSGIGKDTGGAKTASAAGQSTSSGQSTASDGGAGALLALYSALLAQQQAARQAAYERTVAQQQASYEAGTQKVNDAANSALRDAYINKMQSQRTLGQVLSAQGLSGGAAESTLGSLYNSYASSRNQIEASRSDNLAQLAQTLQNNLAAAANERDTGQAADLASYVTNLTDLAAKNPTLLASVQQGSAESPVLRYYLRALAAAESEDPAALLSTIRL